jgi:hypothetical protein
VRALLDGAISDLPPTPEPAPFAPAKPIPVVEYTGYRMQESIDLGKELEDVRAAKELLLPLLDSAHLAGSKLLCEARKDEHSTVAAGVCSAIVALGDAIKAYLALTQEMSVGGPSFYHLRPFDLNLLVGTVGDPTDRNSVIRRVLASAAEGGHFEMKSIPSGWTTTPPAAPAAPPPRRRRSLFYLDKASRIRRRADDATVGKVLTADDAGRALPADDATEATIVANR